MLKQVKFYIDDAISTAEFEKGDCETWHEYIYLGQVSAELKYIALEAKCCNTVEELQMLLEDKLATYSDPKNLQEEAIADTNKQVIEYLKSLH